VDINVPNRTEETTDIKMNEIGIMLGNEPMPLCKYTGRILEYLSIRNNCDALSVEDPRNCDPALDIQ
jgi:hypothetical protein